jgi:hypothetical protein
MSRSNHTTHDGVARRPAGRRGLPLQPDAELLAPRERAALTRAVLRGGGATQRPSLSQTLDWARTVRLHALILDKVLEGEVDLCLSADGSQLVFRDHVAANVVPFAAYQSMGSA